MPVFARAKLVIHDYCTIKIPGSPLPGKRYVTFHYVGPNPQRIYPAIKKMMAEIFGADEKDVVESKFYWDRSAGKEEFSISLDLIIDLDKFTFIHVSVDIDGHAKPSEKFGKEGEVFLKITGRLRTEYPQDTVWQRSIIYEYFRMFFHNLIYKSTRQKYLEMCVALMNRFYEELRKFLNIMASG